MAHGFASAVGSFKAFVSNFTWSAAGEGLRNTPMSTTAKINLLLKRYLAQLFIEDLLGEFHTLVFEYLCILFDDAVQRHADLPGSREDFGIFDDGFIVQ